MRYFFILLALAAPLMAAETLPDSIAKYFQPPTQYANDFGSFRSPLKFDDGREVKTPQDWAARRKEILDAWTKHMGAWPALLEKPKLEILHREERENFKQHRVKVEVSQGQMTEGWLLVPPGDGPFPAVFVPFYEPETSAGLNKDPKAKLRDFALQLTKRGFVTLSIGTPAGDSRLPGLGGATCQPLSYYAYVAANCHTALAQLPYVDGKRIGIVGHSYGGKWSMFGAALYEKYAACVTSDPGIVWDEKRGNVNYWEPWYLGRDPAITRKPGLIKPDNPRTGAYKALVEEGRDLTEIHALIAPRPFLVSGGSEDQPERWPALNHLIAINKVLGFENRVGMTNRPKHDPTEESNEVIYTFFEHFLKEKKAGALQPHEQPTGEIPILGRISGGTLRSMKKFSDDRRYLPPPESQGGWRKCEDRLAIHNDAQMDADKLDELKTWLLESDKRSFAAVVIRHGYIALEVERGNSAKIDARRVASVSKAVCATVLAIASEQSQQGKFQRKMSFDDPAFQFIPWAEPLSDPRKAKITVKQLLNHTSGICPEATGARNEGTWEYVLGQTGDERTAKLAFDPGTASGYSTLALHHAALVCENVTGKSYDVFAMEALFKPLGIEKATFEYFDGSKAGRHASHSIGMPARELARIGYCMLRGGKWGEQQVIPKWFVDETARPTHSVTSPEMRFKINAQVFSHGWELPALHSGDRGRGIPADARYKPGSGGQLLAFVPSLDLVIARQTGSSGEWQYEEFLRRACACIVGRDAVPVPSKDGNGVPSYKIEWAPKENIARFAKGSDNWPLTVDERGVMFGAYGDGQGFNLKGPKLSMGLARVSGKPPELSGENASAPTLEVTGDGNKGRKASGLLCVDGTLYLWARNAGNSQLAWSSDHGATWTWADWKLSESFGAPAFVEFGANYSGARDQYVYVFSHDANTAYETADSVVLARAPKEKLRERSAWEFFSRFDVGGPVWTSDVARRGTVLKNPGKCYRVSASYNAGLKRYLLVHAIPNTESHDKAGKIDTRFSGGVAIYSATEPWGPWSSNFATDNWDVGPGETLSFPPAWMSADGRELWLVFSGEDSLSVRKATLK